MKGRMQLCIGVLIVLAGFLGVSNLLTDNAGALNWYIETIDSVGDVGPTTSLALDSNGHAHISYYDWTNEDLKYARWTGGTWSIETVDSAGTVGLYTSIALDSSGHAHISYYDVDNGDLEYANWNGSVWNIETIDSTDNVGRYTSIAVDSSDHVHIGYFDLTNADLKYAKWNGSAWNTEIVDSTDEVGAWVSIAIDSSRYPHMAYYNTTGRDLMYANWTGSAWSIETVDSADMVGEWTSIAMDSSDYAHISYMDTTNRDLKYANWTGSTWGIETVDSVGKVGQFTSIALDNSDYAHISYFDETNWALKYAMWNGSDWNNVTVDTGDVGWYTSIELDSSGYIHISYTDHANYDLKYAKGSSDALSSAPQNLQAVAGNAQVALTWSAPSSDGGSSITNYSIYRGTTSGGETYLTIVGDVLTYTDTGVTNGITYYYRVSAINGVGVGPQSNEVSGTPATVPTAPQDLQLYPGNTEVDLTWNAPDSDGGSAITNYSIHRGTTSGGAILLTTIGDVLIFTDTGLTNGQAYYYTVSAVNAVGEGPQSNEANGTPLESLNEAPTCTISSPSSGASLSGTVVISGSASDSDGTVEKVEIKIDNGNWIEVTGTTSWSYDWDTTKESNEQHTIYARSYDGLNYSQEASVNVEVSNQSPQSSGKSIFEELWFWILIIIIIVVVVVSLLAYVMMKKKKGPETAPLQPPAAPPPPPE